MSCESTARRRHKDSLCTGFMRGEGKGPGVNVGTLMRLVYIKLPIKITRHAFAQIVVAIYSPKKFLIKYANNFTLLLQ